MTRIPLNRPVPWLVWPIRFALSATALGLGFPISLATALFVMGAALAAIGPSQLSLWLGGAAALSAWLWTAYAVAKVTLDGWRTAGRLRQPAGLAFVGRDGVLIDRLWGRDYIAYRDLHRVRWLSRGAGVELEQTDGDSIRLESRHGRRLGTEILDAWREFRTRAAVPKLIALEIAEPLPAWITRARALHAQPATFRDAALTEAHLLELVEDPHATPAQRIGAALALAQGRDELRQRVQTASEQTAEPNLADAIRLANEHALSTEALQRALD